MIAIREVPKAKNLRSMDKKLAEINDAASNAGTGDRKGSAGPVVECEDIDSVSESASFATKSFVGIFKSN